MYSFTRIGTRGGTVAAPGFCWHTISEAWGLLASYPDRGLGTRLTVANSYGAKVSVPVLDR